MALARNYKEGVDLPALDSAGGTQQGNLVVWSTPDPTSGDNRTALPTGAQPWLTSPYGVSDSAGFIGGTGSVLGEALSIKRQGPWRALLSNGNTTSRGGEIIADSTVLGGVIPRTAYSFSAWVLGTAEEAYGPSTTNDLIEMYLQPYLKEVIRVISGSALATNAAQTRFLGAPGVALNAAAIPLYVARFTGETIRNLRVYVSTAVGGGNSLVFTVMRSTNGGSTFAATALTATIAAAGTNAVDLTDTVMLNAGDVLALQLVSTDTTSTNPGFSFDVT